MEYEDRILESALKKVFKPTIGRINEFSKGGNYTITLEYENIDTKELGTGRFPLKIISETIRGIPFEITLPKF